MLKSCALIVCCAALGFGQLAPSSVYTAAWTSSTGLNAALQEPTGSYNAALVTFAQTSTITQGNAAFEGSDTPNANITDNWFALPCKAPTSSGTSYGFTASTNIAFQCNVVGYQRFRVRLAGAISGTGTANVSLQFLSTGTVNPPAPAVGIASGSPTSVVVCDQSAFLDMTTATTTQIVAAVTGQKVYICSFAMEAAGTTTATLKYGTGSNCGTGTTQFGAAWEWTAQTGIARGAGIGAIKSTPASQALCMTNSAAVDLHVEVNFTQF